MSRQRSVVSRVSTSVALALGASVALATLLALAACGGSSSETPPPLEPDPHGFHYAPAPPVVAEDSDAGDAPTIVTGDDDEVKPRSKAGGSTWGDTPPKKK